MTKNGSLRFASAKLQQKIKRRKGLTLYALISLYLAFISVTISLPLRTSLYSLSRFGDLFESVSGRVAGKNLSANFYTSGKSCRATKEEDAAFMYPELPRKKIRLAEDAKRKRDGIRFMMRTELILPPAPLRYISSPREG